MAVQAGTAVIVAVVAVMAGVVVIAWCSCHGAADTVIDSGVATVIAVIAAVVAAR